MNLVNLSKACPMKVKKIKKKTTYFRLNMCVDLEFHDHVFESIEEKLGVITIETKQNVLAFKWHNH